MNNLTAILGIILLGSIVVIGAVALLSPKEQSSTTSISQQNTDLNSALQEAKSTNKMVFIDFYADWCSYCRQMDETTYKDSQVQQKLSQSYVFVKVDTDDNPELSSQYKVHGLPTILILNGDGQEIKRIEGYQSSQQLISQI